MHISRNIIFKITFCSTIFYTFYTQFLEKHARCKPNKLPQRIDHFRRSNNSSIEKRDIFYREIATSVIRISTNVDNFKRTATQRCNLTADLVWIINWVTYCNLHLLLPHYSVFCTAKFYPVQTQCKLHHGHRVNNNIRSFKSLLKIKHAVIYRSECGFLSRVRLAIDRQIIVHQFFNC